MTDQTPRTEAQWRNIVHHFVGTTKTSKTCARCGGAWWAIVHTKAVR